MALDSVVLYVVSWDTGLANVTNLIVIQKKLLVDKDPINFTNNKDNSDNNGDVL
jgi:hypothetical protein